MVTAWDLETFPFGPSNLAPAPVCLGAADDDGLAVVVASCEPEFDDVAAHCIEQEMTNANIAFDMAVLFQHRPKLRPLILDAYKSKIVHDIIIREKLLTLATSGDLEYRELRNGAKEKLKWGQADIERRILGIDRTDEKEAEDSWRRHFSVLDGIPASEYPKEAFEYVLSDAQNALLIHADQHRRNEESPWDVLAPAFVSVRAAFALYLSSCWGFRVDQKEVDRLTEKLGAQYHEHAVKEDGKPAYDLLLELGILEPSKPARPYAKQEEKAIEALGKKPIDWEPHREELLAKGLKLTKPQKSKYKKKALGDQVRKVCESIGMPVPMTDGGESGDKQVKFDKEVQADLAGHDRALDQYIDRQTIAKLVTTELPRMQLGRVHPKYDVLKKTGRTSSFGNSQKDKDPAYPAVNIQQIDPRVRHAYIANEDYVLCSIDYSFIELVSAAQKCISLFGQSVLADKINAGMDPHAFLGAVLARELSDDFVGSSDNDKNYQLFLELKGSDLYEHFRKLAKPTGLGFPGGLGAATFIAYAKATFGVDLVEIAGGKEEAIELAKELKQIWLGTFPEMRAYFKWVTSDCLDIEFSDPEDERYAYMSPLGMVRRNCRYTEATNGCALQTPTAEGAKSALWELALAMYDERLKSPLLGCHMVAFVHDEVILELPDNDLAHERAFAATEIMIDSMKQITPDVTVKAEPALMYFWSKKAELVLDDNNRLIPWQPAE